MEGWGRPDSIGGHEFSGRVAALGSAVTNWELGASVVGGPTAGCGRCEYCTTHRPSLCASHGTPGVSEFQGAFAEYVRRARVAAAPRSGGPVAARGCARRAARGGAARCHALADRSGPARAGDRRRADRHAHARGAAREGNRGRDGERARRRAPRRRGSRGRHAGRDARGAAAAAHALRVRAQWRTTPSSSAPAIPAAVEAAPAPAQARRHPDARRHGHGEAEARQQPHDPRRAAGDRRLRVRRARHRRRARICSRAESFRWACCSSRATSASTAWLPRWSASPPASSAASCSSRRARRARRSRDASERSPQRRMPTFNHVAMSVPAELLGEQGRGELLRFYGEVFGWTEMPTMTQDRERLVLRVHSNEQFVFLIADPQPMTCPRLDHFGLSVADARGALRDARARAQVPRARPARRDHRPRDRGLSGAEAAQLLRALPAAADGRGPVLRVGRRRRSREPARRSQAPA